MLKKKNIVNYLIIGIIVSPIYILAAGVGDLTGLVTLVNTLFKSILPLIMGLALIFFLWSLANYMLKAGEEQVEARQQMIWGIIILFVMVSVWGLVAILSKTIFG